MKKILGLSLLLASSISYATVVAQWDFRDGNVDKITGLEAKTFGKASNIEMNKNGLLFNNLKSTNNDGALLIAPDADILTGHDNNKAGLKSINIKVDFTPKKKSLAVLVRKTDVGTDYGYQLFIDRIGRVGARIKNYDNKTINVYSKNTIELNKLNQVEATIDTERKPYNLQIKLNGIVSRASAVLTPLSNNKGNLTIGGLLRAKNGSGQYFSGTISFVEISDVTTALDTSGALNNVTAKMSGEHLTKQAGFVDMYFVDEVSVTPEIHAPSIIDLGNGELLATWFGGTCEGHIDVGVYTARFRDGKWERPVEVAQRLIVDENTYYPLWNPLLFKHSSGKVFLFYKYGLIEHGLYNVYKTSDDNGKSWSEPIYPGKHLHGPSKNKPVELADGTIYCPAGGDKMEYSSDLGKTWHVVKMPKSNLKGVIQPTIIKHKDNRLQAIYRTMSEYYIAENYSNDNGKSWGEIKLIDLPSNNSGFDAETLQDGTFIMVYNHAKTEKGRWGGKRTPLNIAVSKDGKLWEAALVIEDEPGEFSYPSIIQGKDGKVHVIYTWNRLKIKHVVLDPAKIVNTKPIINGVWPEL